MLVRGREIWRKGKPFLKYLFFEIRLLLALPCEFRSNEIWMYCLLLLFMLLFSARFLEVYKQPWVSVEPTVSWSVNERIFVHVTLEWRTILRISCVAFMLSPLWLSTIEYKQESVV